MSEEIKHTQEREEVHRAIWAIANDLRGAVDGWDFKNYVLGAMFYRYISETLTNYINSIEAEAGNPNFNYADISDEKAEFLREDMVQEKGYFILPSELFANVRSKALGDSNLNVTLHQIFRNIEDSAKGSEAEDKFRGLFADFDVNSNKLGSSVPKRNERLRKLLEGIAEMQLGSVDEHYIDALGDAYEYLMAMYASNAGKSGGEFFTPSDVSELLTKLGTAGKSSIRKIYDPACGSGSLLLKAINIPGLEVSEFYGQEINITTFNLCRMNMFLHGIGFERFSIACDDTLISPHYWDEKPFDLIVSNPPYAIRWIGDDNPLLINDPRYAPAGVLAPKGKADFAFIMHALSWLSEDGTAAIVCFPGIMYRGGAEQTIRKYLVDNNFVDSVIQLPENLFFGVGIATCILVMKKNRTDNRILFIDASNEYVKATNNNRLSPENIRRIVEVFSGRREEEKFSVLVGADEVAREEYNLSAGRYVDSGDGKSEVDIVKLNAEIREIVAREEELRREIDAIVAEIEGGEGE